MRIEAACRGSGIAISQIDSNSRKWERAVCARVSPELFASTVQMHGEASSATRVKPPAREEDIVTNVLSPFPLHFPSLPLD